MLDILPRPNWMVVLASGFAAACSSQLTPAESGLPATCTAGPLRDDLALPALGSAANGSVTGSEIVARLCDGGASAFMQRTSPTTSPPNELVAVIGSYTADPRRDFQIALPADATRLQLSAIIGPSAAQAGTYTEGNACGDITLCAVMPPSTSVDCSAATPVGDTDTCPPGCTATPSNTCIPAEPTICYEANTVPSCYGGALSAKGSWQLTLSSVAPYTGADSSNVPPGYE